MKRMIGLVGLGVGLGVILTVGVQLMVATVRAESPLQQRRCDYTYTFESGRPNIGHEGEIKYDGSWTKVMNAGWELAFAHPVGSGTSYIFKKCGS